ncbi:MULTISPECIES: hypothetical protein [Mycobacterium tuberculosis complex]
MPASWNNTDRTCCSWFAVGPEPGLYRQTRRSENRLWSAAATG